MIFIMDCAVYQPNSWEFYLQGNGKFILEMFFFDVNACSYYYNEADGLKVYDKIRTASEARLPCVDLTDIPFVERKGR